MLIWCAIVLITLQQAQEAEKLAKDIEEAKQLQKEGKIVSELDNLIEINK